MKKKWLSLLAVPAALCALVPLAACDGSDTQLAYNTKYYLEDDLDEDNECHRVYYIFHKDGTGECHAYSYYENPYSGNHQLYHYTVTFDYSFIDKNKETVICTYKSVSYEADDTEKGVVNAWRRMLLASKDLLMNTGSTSVSYYFSETYLKDHPEFNAKD